MPRDGMDWDRELDYLYDLEAETLAKLFHTLYEKLAPEFGYETRKESAVPWKDVPENNKKLMIAVCKEIVKSKVLN